MRKTITAVIAGTLLAIGTTIPADAHKTGTRHPHGVTERQYDRVDTEYGMPLWKVRRIFERRGVIRVEKPLSTYVIGGEAYIGPERQYTFKSACGRRQHSMPRVNVNFVKRGGVGPWRLVHADGYWSWDCRWALINKYDW